jgi:glycosyl transferase family 25
MGTSSKTRSEPFSSSSENPFINNIDVVYYINLDHRSDRNTEMLQEFEKMGVPETKIVRVPGHYNKNYGDVGCSKSHVEALRKFANSDYNNCIIFEDDFEFTEESSDVHQLLNNLFLNDVNYDVCMLASSTGEMRDTKYPWLKQVNNSQTASGYMVNKPFAETLLRNFEEGVVNLEPITSKDDTIRGQYCIDQYWKKLQPESAWFELYPKLGKQRKSYSDIQQGVVDYHV